MKRRLLAGVLVLGGIAILTVLASGMLLSSRDTARAQARLLGEVPASTAPAVAGRVAPRHPVARGVRPGRALAVLHIPRLGTSWSWVVLEGTSDDVLADGPGHYTGTPLPGDRGNVAIAGHRAGHGDPFLDFDRLRPGDHVVLDQAGTTWDYTIEAAPKIVPVTASWVLDPLPGRSLTLTTCWPRYGSSKRMFVRAHLTHTDQRGTGSSTTLS